MILSVHQPNFIPWIGFFHKIIESDLFVILDTVQYPRGKSVANRNKIKIGNDFHEIVVPISIPKGHEGKVNYFEIKFGDDRWNKKILKTIEMTYSKSLFFNDYYSYFQNLFNSNNFCQMNIDFILFVLKHLNIQTEIVLLSDLKKGFEKKNDLIIGLCNHFSADIYLSGSGASKYNDEEKLVENNITLVYQNYKPKVYTQVKGDFIPYLSIIDLLFNHGKEYLKFI